MVAQRASRMRRSSRVAWWLDYSKRAAYGPRDESGWLGASDTGGFGCSGVVRCWSSGSRSPWGVWWFRKRRPRPAVRRRRPLSAGHIIWCAAALWRGTRGASRTWPIVAGESGLRPRPRRRGWRRRRCSRCTGSRPVRRPAPARRSRSSTPTTIRPPRATWRGFSSQYGLPACTTANGCFTKVDQTGGTSYPSVDAGWALEISLDVQWAHAIAPGAKILLVEANSASFTRSADRRGLRERLTRSTCRTVGAAESSSSRRSSTRTSLSAGCQHLRVELATAACRPRIRSLRPT